MADKWMDERDRQMRERDWRRSEEFGRGRWRDEADRDSYRSSENRSWDEDDYGYGSGYAQPRASGGRSNWQDRDYGGVSPAMRQGGYENRPAGRFRSPEPGGGSRGYGEGGRRYAYRGSTGREDTQARMQGADYSGYGDYSPGGYADYTNYYQRSDARRSASGGTGGYDYERGYGEGPDRDRDNRRDSFMYRAGERVASWFGGGRSPEDRDPERSHRGRGPSGYKRSDERINDDAHERLTDDAWLDATDVTIAVSGGEVTLSGTVESREAKHRAERLVEEISGVHHVQNNLRIARGNILTSAGHGYGDSVLEAQMRGENPGVGPTATDKGKTDTH